MSSDGRNHSSLEIIDHSLDEEPGLFADVGAKASTAADPAIAMKAKRENFMVRWCYTIQAMVGNQ
jgi:hypothetical protein